MYYVSKSLQEVEVRYLPLEKAILADLIVEFTEELDPGDLEELRKSGVAVGVSLIAT